MDRKEFVDLCKKGDEQALSSLYKIYSGRMMKICLRYVSDRQIAEDLLHDGFIVIFTSIKTLRHPEKLESWMGTIMKNISLRYLNQSNTINAVSLSEIEECEEPAELLLPTGFPPYGTMLKMIERLPEGYRKVFKLAVLEGLSHKEIGSLLDIAPHSSSSQLFRAKEMLRKFISEYSITVVLFLLLILPFGIWLGMRKETAKEDKNADLKKETDKQDAGKLINDSIKPSYPSIHKIRYVHLKPVADTVKHEPVFKDSIIELIEIRDTVNMAEDQGSKKTTKKRLHNTNINYFSGKKGHWSLTLAYSGGEKQTSVKYSTIPGDISSGIPEEIKIEERAHHYMPITLSLLLHKKINEHWGVETGIRYTHLRSDFTTINGYHSERIQKIDYLGIPVKGVLQLWKCGKLSIYTSAGATLDIPIKAMSEETRIAGGQETGMKKQNLHAPLQWSVDFGAGFQYHITPSIGIYAEPNLHYYFNNGNKVNTIRKEQPFGITLPIGVRFSW